MKKTISTIALVGLLVTGMVLPSNAVTDGGSCDGNCGPFTISCSGDTYTEPRKHTFDYKGYTKTCSYQYVIAYTNRTCDYCDDEQEHVWTHSHGYRDHAAECGWTNSPDSACYLH